MWALFFIIRTSCRVESAHWPFWMGLMNRFLNSLTEPNRFSLMKFTMQWSRTGIKNDHIVQFYKKLFLIQLCTKSDDLFYGDCLRCNFTELNRFSRKMKNLFTRNKPKWVAVCSTWTENFPLYMLGEGCLLWSPKSALMPHRLLQVPFPLQWKVYS